MRPSEGIISLWPLVVLAVIVVLSAFTITPVTRLKVEAPTDFVEMRAFGGTANADLAMQYWRVATGVIQWRYSRAAALPEQMPADFVLPDTSGKPTESTGQAARATYWAKLRQEWPRPDNWRTTYSFDWHWALRGIRNLSNEALRFLHVS
jgi:hypothetical protein